MENTINKEKIELNKEHKTALDIMKNTKDNLLILGPGGTGKTTLISYFVKNTNKDVAVCAPTGVAALTIKGSTIHSFFGFPHEITVETVHFNPKRVDVLREIDILIIDEVSMVRRHESDSGCSG